MLVIVSLLSVFTFGANAQSDTGSVSGRVLDPAGAIMPGAKITLRNVDTGITTMTTANSEGIYRFSLVRPGSYTVTAEFSGMKKSQQKVDVSVSQDVGADLPMETGSVDTVISVEENAVQLETQTSNLATNVGEKEMEGLPNIGRNPYAFAALAPGITPLANFGLGIGANGVTPAQQAAYNNNFMANGGTSGYNEVLLDGAPITVCCQGQPAYTPSQEIVQQLKVQTSVPSAQFGLTSGGILNNITKSGTNRIHGSASDFIQNTVLNAANYFTKQHGVPPIPGRTDYRNPAQSNTYGANVGGPIFIPHFYDGRNRSFFFFGFQGIGSKTSSYTTTTVPTMLERQGILTEAPTSIYNPYSSVQTAPGVYQRTAFAGNKITTINPVSAKLLAYYPLPTSAALTSNYSYMAPSKVHDRQYSLRLDHKFNERYSAYLRLTRDLSGIASPDLFGKYTGPNAFNQNLTAYVANFGQTFTYSPRTLFDLKYGFAYQKNGKIPLSTAIDPSSLGLPQNFTQYQQPGGFPEILVSGLAQLGVPDHFEWSHYTHFIGFSTVMQRGAHTLTAGFDGRQIMTNEFTTYAGQGVFSFSSGYLTGPNSTSTLPAGQANFNAFGAFLLGAPSSGNITQNARFAYYQRYMALYLQDDWKATSRLTLNMGIRYDYQGSEQERHQKTGVFNPTLANPLSQAIGLPFSGGVQIGGQAGAPNGFFRSASTFGPRFGLAYQAASNLTLRGAYGILYLPTSQRFYNSPNPAFAVQTDMLSSVTGAIPTNLIDNPFPTGVVQPAGPSADLNFGIGSSTAGILYDTPSQYVQQWNAGMELAPTRASVFSLTYAGSHGVHLLRNITPNDLDPQYYQHPGDAATVAYLNTSVANPFYGRVSTGILTAPTVQRLQLTRKFPQYNVLTEQFTPGGSASYNALQIRFQQRDFHHLSTILGYTWSKNLSDVSNLTTGGLAEGTPGYQNSYFLNLERAYSPGDTPQRFTASIVYDLPFGRGKEFFGHSGSLADELIGNFRVSSVTQLYSGLPLQITDTGCAAFAGSRPNVVRGISKVTPGSTTSKLSGYLNKNAFACPVSLQLGTAPRLNGDARGPGFNTTDISVSKGFAIGEAMKLELRFDARNAFNHTHFGTPNTSFNSAAFGQITASSNQRVGELGLRATW
jgi:hypothetical protein